jgi:hypothetical protein
MRIYQVYLSDDMAASDSFYPTKAEAMRAVREHGGVGRGEVQDDGRGVFIRLCFHTSTADGYEVEVYLETHDVAPTREGICRALKNIPNR